MAALLGIAAAMASGCGGPTPAGCIGICLDAQLPDGSDAGVPVADAPSRLDSNSRDDAGLCPQEVGRNIGAACRTGDLCLDPLECAPQVQQALSMGVYTQNPDGGVSAGGRPFPLAAFPDGMCFERCNPNAADSCGDCASCNGAVPQGRFRFGVASFFGAEITGICRDDCVPSTTDNGGCRDGYTCDILTGTCVEACANNEQCQFHGADVNGDRVTDFIDEGADSPASCVAATGRCDVPGNDAASAGDPCVEDTDCEDNGTCLDFASDPDGYCTRLGCGFPGFACDGTDETCDYRALGGGITACLEGCTVGAETTAEQRRGVGGGNPTCSDPGMTCVWNGISRSTDTINGSCLPGNYNAETAYDVGTACLDDSDCWSPFGYGRCLFTNVLDQVQSGMCAVGGCLGGTGGMRVGLLAGTDAIRMVEPAVSAEICAPEDVCVNFSATIPTTFCLGTCESAADCAPGYACPNLNTAAMPLFVCWPFCQMDSECRAGTTCRNPSGGACGAGANDCTCSDAMPAPIDAGPGDGGPLDAAPDVDAASLPDAGNEAGPPPT